MTTRHESLGDVAGAANRRRVTLRRVFRFPAEEVWAALVEPDRIRAWFAPARLDPRVGGLIELENADGSRMMEGVIRAFDPPRLLEYDWVSPYETTIVRYELEPVASGTRLTLTEHLLTDRATERRGAGWHHHLERLDDHLRGAPNPGSEARWRELRAAYGSLL